MVMVKGKLDEPIIGNIVGPKFIVTDTIPDKSKIGKLTRKLMP